MSVPLPPLTHSSATPLHPNLFTFLFSPLHPTSLSCPPFCSHYTSFTPFTAPHSTLPYSIITHAGPSAPLPPIFNHIGTANLPLLTLLKFTLPHSLSSPLNPILILALHSSLCLHIDPHLTILSTTLPSHLLITFFLLLLHHHIVCSPHLYPPAHVSSRLCAPSLRSSV